MTQNQLQYFVAVRKYMNFSRAAERLFVTQPAVSRQIAALEEELGARLFDRKGGKLSLTPAGKIFAAGADGILSLMETTAQKIRDIPQNEESVFILGHHRPDSDFLFFKALAALEDKVSGVSIQLRFANPEILLSELSSGKLDALIIPEFSCRLAQRGDYHVTKLYQDQYFCILSSESPFAGRSSISLQDLRDMTLYIWAYRDEILDPPFISAIRANASEYRIQYFEKPEEAFAMVSIAHGISFSFGWYHKLPSGLFQLPICDAPPIDFLLVWRKTSFPDRFDSIVRCLLNYYHKEAESE